MMESPAKIVVHVGPLSRKEIRQYVRAISYGPMPDFSIAGIPIVSLLLTIIAFQLAPTSDYIVAAYYGLIFFTTIYTLRYWLVYSNLKKMGGHLEHRLEFSNVGIAMVASTGPVSEASIRWDSVKQVTVQRGFLVVKSKSGVKILIPLTSFSGGDLSAVYSMLDNSGDYRNRDLPERGKHREDAAEVSITRTLTAREYRNLVEITMYRGLPERVYFGVPIGATAITALLIYASVITERGALLTLIPICLISLFTSVYWSNYRIGRKLGGAGEVTYTFSRHGIEIARESEFESHATIRWDAVTRSRSRSAMWVLELSTGSTIGIPLRSIPGGQLRVELRDLIEEMLGERAFFPDQRA